jgi:16S rRNA (cytosine967-C5)-methyltransferase
VALALGVEPGLRVIDACAGGGGKSLHLAALMKNKGKINALDTVAKKLEQVRVRASRDGASCIETRAIESTKTIKRLRESADRLLLDVPCSGLGVLRRNPDSKWKLSPLEIDQLIQTQAQILQQYSSMLKPGGVMVYATCSILPCENEQQIAKFMTQNEAVWTLDFEEHLWPRSGGGDGFYIARLRKS